MTLQFDLYAAGVLAPGITSLAQLLAISRGTVEPASPALQLPIPQALPANERRRASLVVRLTLACAEQAFQNSPFAPDAVRMVFASDEGTGEVCQQMLAAVTTTCAISPLLFHNSVHNAPSGYLSIAYRNHQSATSVSLGMHSFAGGLLCAASEATTSGQPVLLLAYDAPLGEAMRSLLAIEHATATAWIIASGERSRPGPAALARFELSLQAAATQAAWVPPSWLPMAWAASSSAQGLAALALLDNDDAQAAASIELGLAAQFLRITRTRVTAPC
jgi:hypothetical protein